MLLASGAWPNASADAAMGTLVKLWNRLMCYCRRRSPWLFHMNSGSCNGCDIEMVASSHATLRCRATGRTSRRQPAACGHSLRDRSGDTQCGECAIKTVYGQVCGPKAVVAIGSCPATTNVFIDSRTLDGPSEQAHSRGCIRARLPAAARRDHRGRGQGRRNSGR